MPAVVKVIYSYSDRRNGWYCYAADANDYQLGNAEYRFTKREIIACARELAHSLNVPVERG